MFWRLYHQLRSPDTFVAANFLAVVKEATEEGHHRALFHLDLQNPANDDGRTDGRQSANLPNILSPRGVSMWVSKCPPSL
jgi:hypothetical protein